MYDFIVNPNARSGLGGRIWKELEQLLKEQKAEYRIHFTKYQRHASRIAEEITTDGEEHTIVVLGGDGTVNEVLNGITELSKVTMGYIPMGSSNDFARYFKMAAEPVECLTRILHPKKMVNMNVGIMSYKNGEKSRRYAVSTGIGFDAAVCHQAVISKMKVFLNKIHLGKLTYLGIALSRMIALRPGKMRVRLDDGEWIEYDRVYFATAMNHPFEGGGFKFCPDADPCDDILNVTVISGLPKWKVLCLLPTAFKGWHIRFRGIDTYTCKKVEIDSEQALPVHTDGEPVFLQRKMTAALEVDKIRLIVG